MNIGDRIISQEFGEMIVTKQEHSPIGNKLVFVGIDRAGQEHELKGTEPLKVAVDEKVAEIQDTEVKTEKKKAKKKTHEQKKSATMKKILDDKMSVAVNNFPESEELKGTLEGILKGIKDIDTQITVENDMKPVADVVAKLEKVQIDTVAAIQSLPDPIAPNDYTEQFNALQDELKAKKVDLSGVIKLLSQIENKELDLSGLTEISAKLDKLDDVIEKVEAIKFEIPEKFIHKDSIKVSPDRVATGGGGGGGLSTEAKQEATLEHYKITDIDNSSPAYYGFMNKDGEWYIMINNAGEYRYTKGDLDYSTNWSNRASLTYDYFDNVF